MDVVARGRIQHRSADRVVGIAFLQFVGLRQEGVHAGIELGGQADRLGHGVLLGEIVDSSKAYSAMPSRSAMEWMSLSPRPERFASTIASFGMPRARRMAMATAWLDSSAARMPSVRASRWKASMHSASVTPS